MNLEMEGQKWMGNCECLFEKDHRRKKMDDEQMARKGGRWYDGWGEEWDNEN